jgi:hypothetical protein
MIKDSVVDWFNKANYPKQPISGFTSFIMKRGNDFEQNLIKYINDNKYPITKIITNNIKINIVENSDLFVIFIIIIYNYKI